MHEIPEQGRVLRRAGSSGDSKKRVRTGREARGPQRRLDVVYRPVDDLTPDPRNPRRHPKRQIEQLIASITTFGFTNPILIDADGLVIAGHGRLEAAKAADMLEVPTIVLDGLDEAHKRALRIADNKIALNGGWDQDLLRLEFANLAIEIDLDLAVTGFSAGEIAVVLDGAEPEREIIPARPERPRTRRGDIWILGEHRVGCGEPDDAAVLAAVVGQGERMDAAFLTLPSPRPARPATSIGGRGRAQVGFDESEDAVHLTETLGRCAQLSRDGAVHFVCTDWRDMDAVLTAGKRVYGVPVNLCVWTKAQGGADSLYRGEHELIFVFRVGQAPPPNPAKGVKAKKARSNVWTYSAARVEADGSNARAADAAAKPIALVVDALEDVTKPGDLILDVAGAVTFVQQVSVAPCWSEHARLRTIITTAMTKARRLPPKGATTIAVSNPWGAKRVAANKPPRPATML